MTGLRIWQVKINTRDLTFDLTYGKYKSMFQSVNKSWKGLKQGKNVRQVKYMTRLRIYQVTIHTHDLTLDLIDGKYKSVFFNANKSRKV